MNETHTTNKQTNKQCWSYFRRKKHENWTYMKALLPNHNIRIQQCSESKKCYKQGYTTYSIRAGYKIKRWPAMPLRLLLTSLHHLFVVALKRENLTIVLHTFIKTNGFGQMYINANNLLSTCLSLAIQLGLPLLGAEEGLVLHPSLSSPALLDSQESVGL